MSARQSEIETPFECSFELNGGKYRILKDTSRPPLAPTYYVQRMNDHAVTERYYSWPDGAFSAVFWGRAKWC